MFSDRLPTVFAVGKNLFSCSAKRSDLRQKLEETKARAGSKPINYHRRPVQRPEDPATKQASRARPVFKCNHGRISSLRRLISISQGLFSTSCNFKNWPSKPENDHQITFSPVDSVGVHMPHNDPLLVELGIATCDVAKVLIYTSSSVDLILRNTLDKMGVNLHDMKPLSRSLTGFNGASETTIGMIKIPVYACGVTRTVKLSVMRTSAPYNAILGTPWLHSMNAISSTYHQCVKFPGPGGHIQTLREDQQAAHDLLIATVKMQQSTPRINAISKQIQPQKDEIL